MKKVFKKIIIIIISVDFIYKIFNKLMTYGWMIKFQRELLDRQKLEIQQMNNINQQNEEEYEVDYEEDFYKFNQNLNKINKNIDFSLLGNMRELNINDEFKEENEENIFSDEN